MEDRVKRRFHGDVHGIAGVHIFFAIHPHIVQLEFRNLGHCRGGRNRAGAGVVGRPGGILRFMSGRRQCCNPMLQPSMLLLC